VGGGDRVPSRDEIERCSRHLRAEVAILKPELVIPVGKLAIEQFFPDLAKLTEVIGGVRRGELAGHEFDVIALPHPSGASTWHRTEPGKTLLARALARIEKHDAWRSLLDRNAPQRASVSPP
jgi:uracil-DNA glycosylase